MLYKSKKARKYQLFGITKCITKSRKITKSFCDIYVLAQIYHKMDNKNFLDFVMVFVIGFPFFF